MKTIKLFSAIAVFSICIFVLANGCAVTQSIQEKDGSALWGENCLRCHNAPDPTHYTDSQWDVIGNHMKVRANLTDEEVKKIVQFLQSAN